MGETFRLLNRHGTKLWFGSVVTGCCIFVFLLLPLLFFAMIMEPKSADLLDLLKRLAASPRTVESIATESIQIVMEHSRLVAGYIGFFMLLTLLSITFFRAGLIGAIRQAVLENQTGIGHFFSYGFRYLFRVIGLNILSVLAFGILLTGWGCLSILTMGESFWMILLAIIGGILSLLLLNALTHSSVVMFAEEMGVFRSFANGFKLLFSQFGRTVVSCLLAMITAVLTSILVMFIAVFPWLILRFFDDGAIADMVGFTFGAVLLVLLGTLPTITAYVILFRRYILRNAGDLFPEDDQTPVQLLSSIDGSETDGFSNNKEKQTSDG
ncbi:hypothetical protein [Melghirimyces algeriensis]|uniref:Membrane domain of glycerophosphoryl diester phosphodiesterase n=1 Tax=Melghirimyces algeriensis TaxID=910412 RepID=A0A521AM87_9BACL|nr:hypothetical protein [Melghirimyces algeriensis]SMO35905.1 hypothetical protein SAMN06264849_101224 [Melghirimyces algeriensis]